MPVPYHDLAKERQQEALKLCLEAQGEYLDLGKKISVPRDVMMEELNLLSNRGSRMFQERLKRVEKFTLEGAGSRSNGLSQQSEIQGQQAMQEAAVGSNYSTELSTHNTAPGRTSLLTTLQHTLTRKGNPSVLAPGYSQPLQEVPPEKFNITIIPKSYCSPWEEPRDSKELLANINAHLPEPPHKLTPANYKCFNRAPMPFGGTAGSVRTLPLPGFELLQAHTEPSLTWERICERPNFNRTPRGWRAQYTAESMEL